jgi:hypothetical protein
VRHPVTRNYRRTRLVFTLGYNRKSVRLLTFTSSARRWAELHEETFRRLGGTVAAVVLDNLKESVLTPDIYDPMLNPLFRDVLAHYGAVALPCRVRQCRLAPLALKALTSQAVFAHMVCPTRGAAEASLPRPGANVSQANPSESVISVPREVVSVLHRDFRWKGGVGDVGTGTVDGTDVGFLVDLPRDRTADLSLLRDGHGAHGERRRPFHVHGTASTR